jgi:hypothetical protein
MPLTAREPPGQQSVYSSWQNKRGLLVSLLKITKKRVLIEADQPKRHMNEKKTIAVIFLNNSNDSPSRLSFK